MKQLLFTLLLLVTLGIPGLSQAVVKYQSIASQGNTQVSSGGVGSTNKVLGSYPSCTVTVYLTGTLTLATLYSDSSLTPKSNPFTATSEGYLEFYIIPGTYDLRFSGTGITTPFTRSIVDIGLSRGTQYEYYTLAARPTCTATLRGRKIQLTDSNKGTQTCTLTISSTYAWVDDANGLYIVSAFGADGSDVTADTAALQAVFTAAPINAKIYFPKGNYIIDLTSASLTLKSGQTVYGDGSGVSKITVTGSGVYNLFQATNLSDVTISGISLIGNSSATASGNGEAISFIQNGSATATGVNLKVENCYLDNWKGDSWIEFYNDNATYTISGVTVQNCVFKSRTGNARNGASVAVPSSCISISGTAAGADITDILVDGNTADCLYIKSFCMTYYGAGRQNISNNIVKNVGTHAQISDDAGAYAFMVYDSAGTNNPDLTTFTNNTIDGVRSIGIYAAGSNRVHINGLVAIGQTDLVTASLPKGLIVNSGCSEIVIENVQLSTCAYGITVNSSAGIAQQTILKNVTVTSATVAAVELNAQSSGNAYLIDIDGLYIRNTGSNVRGLFIQATSAYAPGKLIVKNFNIHSTASAIEQFSGDSSVPIYGYAEFSNGTVSGYANYGIRWDSVSNSSSRTVIKDVVFSGATAGANMLSVQASHNLTLDNLTFQDMTTGGGAALNTTTARGRLSGVRFMNVADARRYQTTGGEELGVDTPTWTGAASDFIQNLNPVEAGGTGAKNSLQGWQWDTGTAAWKTIYEPSQATYGAGSSPSFLRVTFTDKDQATAVAGAATCNTQIGTITSEALTTAAGAAYTLTLTNSLITTSSRILMSIDNGTNSAGTLSQGEIRPGSGSATFVVRNIHAANALNGTIKITFFVIP